MVEVESSIFEVVVLNRNPEAYRLLTMAPGVLAVARAV
jgi:hypothetical protein